MASLSLLEFDRALRRGLGVPEYAAALAGVDEAGRGAWAGPVVAAAVCLPNPAPPELHQVRDSKLLPPKKREFLFEAILRNALSCGVGFASHEEVDRLNVLQATFKAMARALEQISIPVHLAAVDGRSLIPDLRMPQKAVVDGDAKSLSIAAASILAKVTRDRWMREISSRHPFYGFELHKGYGTELHQQRLSLHGPCEIHRKSYAPIRELSKQIAGFSAKQEHRQTSGVLA